MHAGGCHIEEDITGKVSSCWTSVLGLLVALAVLAFAAEAQAYVSGDLVYAKRIGTSAGPAGSYSVAAGPDGVTVVAGWKIVPGVAYAPMVAKYSVSGERLWLRTYIDSYVYGWADEVAVDANGSVFVAGTVNTGVDGVLILLRYGSAGTFKWVRTYQGPPGAWDYVKALVIDKAGNIIVVGQSLSASGKWGIVVLKYDRTGTMLWAEPVRFDPDPTDPDAGHITPNDAACDADGNVYVAGASAHWNGVDWISSALMLKFAATDGCRVWSQVYDPVTNPQSVFGSVAVRGTLVVGVGSTWPYPDDALVVRYNTSGIQKYAREWGLYDECFNDVVIDGSYNVYVTGSQRGNWSKAVTMKLHPDLTTAWKALYFPISRWAEGWYIARNSLGNVYVAGMRWPLTGTPDILTIKYGATGAQKWVRGWSAGGPGDDEAWGLVLGTAGGAYVAGEVTNKDDFEQAVLLKYKL